jgi:hypothetical protein
MAQLSRGNRTGRNFTVRISEAEMESIGAAGFGIAGPDGLGPWLLWRAGLRGGSAGAGQCHDQVLALPPRADREQLGMAMPPRRPSGPCLDCGTAPPAGQRVVLDLCGGSGAWSEPYRRAGYPVELVTLEVGGDVRTYRPPVGVWGVLAAPPCTEFSIAKTCGQRRLADALITVTHCLRVIAEARPIWWALENPASGLLRTWLGRPRDVWQPADFGDAWTKRTAVWGCFTRPSRRHCRAAARMPGSSSAERAITPPGFAARFFDANP